MNKQALKLKACRIIGKIQKKSPTILTWAGVIGVGVSLGLACRSTVKAIPIIAASKESLDSIDNIEDEFYCVKDRKKDVRCIYARTGLELAKTFAPPLVLCTASLTGIVVAHNISNSRNLALSAAYVAVDRGFTSYKQRVEDRFGKDVEREIRYDIKNKDIIETTTIDGKEKKKKKTIAVVPANPDGPHDFVFSKENSKYFDDDHSYNMMFLRAQEAYANDKLRATGRVFLNELFRALGMEETKDGQILGWVYDKENPVGDNWVDFGIYECVCEDENQDPDSENRHKKAILLDFNVDGDVWSLMD